MRFGCVCHKLKRKYEFIFNDFLELSIVYITRVQGLCLQNKMNINDWHSIQTLWDKLNKQVDKTKKVTGMLGTPRPYIKIIVELDDFLTKTLAGTFFV